MLLGRSGHIERAASVRKDPRWVDSRQSRKVRIGRWHSLRGLGGESLGVVPHEGRLNDSPVPIVDRCTHLEHDWTRRSTCLIGTSGDEANAPQYAQHLHDDLRRGIPHPEPRLIVKHLVIGFSPYHLVITQRRQLLLLGVVDLTGSVDLTRSTVGPSH